MLVEAGLPFSPPDGQAVFPHLTVIGHASTPVDLDDVYAGADNPLFEDADHDGIDDGYERENGLDPTRDDAGEDPDGDGLTNLQEYQLGTRANLADSDGDGMSDGWEVRYGLDPLEPSGAADTDGDGTSDLREYLLGRNPTRGVLADDGTFVGLSLHAPAATP